MRSVKRISTLPAAIAGTLKWWMWSALGIPLIMLAGTGAGPGPTSECAMPSVPVILDGVRYESGEFNSLQSKLCGEVDLIFTVYPEHGDLYAFTTKERIEEWWGAKHGLPALDEGATEAGGMGPILMRGDNIYVCAPTDSLEDCESRVESDVKELEQWEEGRN